MERREPGGISIPPSYPELVRQMLEKEIIEGNLAAGERVSEDELARRLGVSRTPVREAMRVLEGHGLIVRQRGKGTYVARLTTSAEAETLYQLRGAARRLSGRASGRRHHRCGARHSWSRSPPGSATPCRVPTVRT